MFSSKLLGRTRSERIGIIILSCILFIVIVIPEFIPETEFPPEDTERLKADFDSFSRRDTLTTNNLRAPAKQRTYNLFVFDPNTVDSSSLCLMGFSAKQTSVVLNYRKSGAVFKVKEDFKKCYVVSDEMYDRLKDYIVIKSSTVKPLIVELNSADSSNLVSLRGIGPYYAKRIMEYRERLGGFCNPEQLLEINGIDDERYEMFVKNVKVNTNLIRKLKINSVDEKRLRIHPYIGERYANKIIKFRESKRIESFEEMSLNSLFNTGFGDLIEQYIEF